MTEHTDFLNKMRGTTVHGLRVTPDNAFTGPITVDECICAARAVELGLVGDVRLQALTHTAAGVCRYDMTVNTYKGAALPGMRTVCIIGAALYVRGILHKVAEGHNGKTVDYLRAIVDEVGRYNKELVDLQIRHDEAGKFRDKPVSALRELLGFEPA